MNGHASKQERINDRRAEACGKRADEHRANERNRVGFENVRRHACAITDIIAHVIGNGCRVARIVLVEIRLHLSNQVRSDIRSLRINAAAQTREDRNERRAQSHANEARNRPVRAHLGHHEPKDTDGQKRQADDQQARHGAAIEGSFKGFFSIQSRPLCRANISHYRNSHSDVTGGKRADCSQQKSCRRRKIAEHRQQDKNDNRNCSNR